MIKKILLVMLFSAVASVSAAPRYYADSHKVAASGYDVVAYFNNEATRGIPGIEVEYDGFIWYFETQANADLFQRNPEYYAPMYGGYCAYGVSQGYLVSSDPEAWSVINDRLYLNYNQGIRARWLKDAEQYIVLSEKLWPRLLAE